MSSPPVPNREAHDAQSSVDSRASSPSDSSNTPTPTPTPSLVPQDRAQAQQEPALGQGFASQRHAIGPVDDLTAGRDSFSSILDDPFPQDYKRVEYPSSNHPISSDRAPPPSSSRGGNDKPTPPSWPPPRRESLNAGGSQFRVRLSIFTEGVLQLRPVPCPAAVPYRAPLHIPNVSGARGRIPGRFQPTS